MNRHRGSALGFESVRGRKTKRGFTLVELLVVISIIGMLMALLLPAVQAARETGRRNTCSSNQHNISLALIQFAEAKRYYPGWSNNMPTATNASPPVLGNLTVSWLVPLFPYMERTDVYNALASGNSTNQSNALVYMNLLICPSNPPTTTSSVTPTAYVINGGQNSGGVMLPGSTIAQIPYAAASGIAYDLSLSNTPTPVGTNSAGTATNVKVSQDYIVAHDGSTYTMLISENDNITNQQWSPPQSSFSSYTGGANLGLANSFGQYGITFSWAGPAPASTLSQSAPSGYYRINGNKGTSPTPSLQFMRPASNHPGGVNVAFCGGNVRFLAEDIAYYVYKQLMTPYGNGALTPMGATDSDLYNIPLNENSF